MSIFTEIKRLISHFRHQGLRRGLLAAYDKFIRWRTGLSPNRFCMLSESLWLGGQPNGAGFDTLEDYGVTALINMRSEYDYLGQAELRGLKYLRLPTDDNGAPSIKDLEAGVRFIREELSGGGKVYVHCWEGLGRSATMAAAYYVSEGKTPLQAWREIRQVRPFIRPTRVQLERILEYSKMISGDGD
jgi:hypothetical protein